MNEIINKMETCVFDFKPVRKNSVKSKDMPITPRSTVRDKYQPIQGDLKVHQNLTKSIAICVDNVKLMQ